LSANDRLPALPAANPMCSKCAQNGFGGPAKIRRNELSACYAERMSGRGDWI
jgi:hypothetical protein